MMDLGAIELVEQALGEPILPESYAGAPNDRLGEDR